MSCRISTLDHGSDRICALEHVRMWNTKADVETEQCRAKYLCNSQCHSLVQLQRASSMPD